jgi:hypothetical protein
MNAYRHTMVKIGSVFALAAVLTASAITNAEGAASLRIRDGVNPQILIDDNQAGDLNPLLGVITYSSPIGVFIVDTGAGTTKPVQGSETAPLMTLSGTVVGIGAGTLEIAFSDTDFERPESGFSMGLFAANVGGAGTSISYDAFYDLGNVAFAVPFPIGSLGPFGPGAFLANTSGDAPDGNGLYSLTQFVTITYGAGGGSTVFGATLIPEPALLSLFGLGLAGFGIAAKRRRVKVQESGLV